MSDSSQVDTFIRQCSPDMQDRLRTIRQTVHDAVPEATETLSYKIPTFRLFGQNLLHYGPGKSHIGLYATPDGHTQFASELSRYKRGKGSVQFPNNEPLPVELIRKIAIFRADELRKKEAGKHV